ncbi:MAG: hypothetical protein ACPL1Z_05295 [Candidatus Bathyarchaeales archaeon]
MLIYAWRRFESLVGYYPKMVRFDRNLDTKRLRFDLPYHCDGIG